MPFIFEFKNATSIKTYNDCYIEYFGLYKLEIVTVSIKFIVIIFSSHILGIILIGLDGYF